MASKDKDTTSTTQEIPDAGVDDAAPISVPDSADTGEGGKLKMIVQLVKKCLGVKDIATMRLSLPASLLEPIPNLEYWNYLDRPDIFAHINDHEDALERMIAVVRFTLTKDLKFVHGKVCKPYNSVLGEHFQAHWDVPPVQYPTEPDHPPIPQICLTAGDAPPPKPETTLSATGAAAASDNASVKSARSSKSVHSGLSSFNHKSPSTAATSPQQLPEDAATAAMSNLDLGPDGLLRVVYLTEQVSHHPPISAYYATCPSKGLEAYGIDQISAKVSGTTVRVAPGVENKGLFVNIKEGNGKGERYRITHPVASVNGVLRGSFYITVSDTTIITCEGSPYRTLIEYKEESWLGKAHFHLEGVVFTVSDGDTAYESWTKVKNVPKSRQVAIFEGSWRGEVRWKRVGDPKHHQLQGKTTPVPSSVSSSPSPSHVRIPTPSIKSVAASRTDLPASSGGKMDEWAPLLDVNSLQVVPKRVRPLEKQLATESRKLWDGVTSRLLKKEFSEATREKMAIEQRQRDEAAERKRKGEEFVPRYFEKDMEKGYSDLTEAGRKAVEEELKEVLTD